MAKAYTLEDIQRFRARESELRQELQALKDQKLNTSYWNYIWGSTANARELAIKDAQAAILKARNETIEAEKCYNPDSWDIMLSTGKVALGLLGMAMTIKGAKETRKIDKIDLEIANESVLIAKEGGEVLYLSGLNSLYGAANLACSAASDISYGAANLACSAASDISRAMVSTSHLAGAGLRGAAEITGASVIGVGSMMVSTAGLLGSTVGGVGSVLSAASAPVGKLWTKTLSASPSQVAAKSIEQKSSEDLAPHSLNSIALASEAPLDKQKSSWFWPLKKLVPVTTTASVSLSASIESIPMPQESVAVSASSPLSEESEVSVEENINEYRLIKLANGKKAYLFFIHHDDITEITGKEYGFGISLKHIDNTVVRNIEKEDTIVCSIEWLKYIQSIEQPSTAWEAFKQLVYEAQKKSSELPLSNHDYSANLVEESQCEVSAAGGNPHNDVELI